MDHPEPTLGARVARVWWRLREGMRATLPLGEVGVEAA